LTPLEHRTPHQANGTSTGSNVWGEQDRFVAVTPGQGRGGNGSSAVVADNKGNHKFRGAMIAKCVVDHIYPKKKFICLEDELAYGARLQKKVFKHFEGVPEGEQLGKELWFGVREQVRKRLARKRNNVQEYVRRKMTSK